MVTFFNLSSYPGNGRMDWWVYGLRFGEGNEVTNWKITRAYFQGSAWRMQELPLACTLAQCGLTPVHPQFPQSHHVSNKRVPKETPQHKESVGQLIWSATQSTFVHRFALIFNLNYMVKDRHCRCLIRPQLGTLHPTIAWLSEQYHVALDLLLHAKPSPRWQLGGTDEE